MPAWPLSPASPPSFPHGSRVAGAPRTLWKLQAQPGSCGGCGGGQQRGEPSLALKKPGKTLGALGHDAVGQEHPYVTV